MFGFGEGEFMSGNVWREVSVFSGLFFVNEFLNFSQFSFFLLFFLFLRFGYLKPSIEERSFLVFAKLLYVIQHLKLSFVGFYLSLYFLNLRKTEIRVLKPIKISRLQTRQTLLTLNLNPLQLILPHPHWLRGIPQIHHHRLKIPSLQRHKFIPTFLSLHIKQNFSKLIMLLTRILSHSISKPILTLH